MGYALPLDYARGAGLMPSIKIANIKRSLTFPEPFGKLSINSAEGNITES